MKTLLNNDIEIQISEVVDAKDLFFPLPLLKTKKELAKISTGDVLQVDITDLNARKAIIGWCERSKNNFLGEKENRGYMSFFIRKTAPVSL